MEARGGTRHGGRDEQAEVNVVGGGGHLEGAEADAALVNVVGTSSDFTHGS